MPATPVLDLGPRGLRRTLARLEGLPMRPASARLVLARADDDDTAPDRTLDGSRLPSVIETDPAWALVRARSSNRPVDPLIALAEHRWWPTSAASDPSGEALGRLWKFSTAVAFAARRLAREASLDDPDAFARAGLLHGLGLWALAAVVPDRLAEWFATSDPVDRRALEFRWLETEASNLGRDLAEAWGCEPLVVDAAWLHADLEGDLGACSNEPTRLALIQKAFALARRTPWAPGAEDSREHGPGDPRVKILTAEVQSRCGGNFVDPDATAREERLTRDNARLRRTVARLQVEHASNDRFVRAVAESSPTENPETWAERAGLALCGEPGVASARVDWSGTGSSEPTSTESPPNPVILTLGDPQRPSATIHLGRTSNGIEPPPTLEAWDAWARAIDERARLRSRIDELVSAHRGRLDREGPARRKAKLDALAEFAAGAGHELNNPLAVVLGRAQLLMSREDDPEAIRSLRAIITQAQRAHRILRDLMYVARPPEPRPRPCIPEEIVRNCLRDLQTEAEARGVRIVSEAREPGSKVWADPDPLRQIADILVRNALEATPVGGSVRFVAGSDGKTLRWSVHDTGHGIGATEGMHLLDPFYCGRQAGRGLGLGLPRAARIVEQVGGDLRWQSVPGHGTTFHVSYPIAEIPPTLDEDRPAVVIPPRALPVR
ncbi:ATP-binding protein [Tundrisphaera lichenicola]|uniref:ATP-binding protein n=1 Tax=Tundrisphaera lichenicola TaxID=2029860 RepID=UPI003EBCD644